MAFDFPAAPADGAEFTPPGGPTYIFQTPVWLLKEDPIAPPTIISDTPPPPPLIAGQLWYESDTGNTYIWYDDGTSAQWIQIAPGAGFSVPPADGAPYMFKDGVWVPADHIGGPNAPISAKASIEDGSFTVWGDYAKTGPSLFKVGKGGLTTVGGTNLTVNHNYIGMKADGLKTLDFMSAAGARQGNIDTDFNGMGFVAYDAAGIGTAAFNITPGGLQVNMPAAHAGFVLTTGNSPLVGTLSGYQKLAGGFILQWGSITASSIDFVITYPVAFVNGVVAIQCSPGSGFAGNNVAGLCSADPATSLTQFTIRPRSITGAAGPVPATTETFYWTAIGF